MCLPGEQSGGSITATQDDSCERMLGDINLFVGMSDDEECPSTIGEVELMVAVKNLQGKGYGRAGLLAFLRWIFRQESSILEEHNSSEEIVSKAPLQFQYLRVKIHQSNHRSVGLFESVGFRKVGEGANFFGELELRLHHPQLFDLVSRLDKDNADDWCEKPYYWLE
ncbi:hypothetical protein MMC20_004667 [Loxospora ochrophaea]|nr:hypothetical protein [Loxospora ochrophaea]